MDNTIKECKLYVLVRRDLPWPVRCVQSIHAVLVLYEHNYASAQMPVVLVGVSNENELENWQNIIGDDAVGFYEPDLDEQLTAVAFLSSPRSDLDQLKLL